jgi:hypothetical protein
MANVFDPYHRWLGIAPKDQPPNHYRLLAIDLFESDAEVIRDAAEQRIAHVRTYQLGQHADLSQKMLNELAAAKSCLLDPERRAAYDAELRSRLTPPVPDAAPAPSAPGPPSVRPLLPCNRSVRWGAKLATFGAVAGAVLLVAILAWALSGERPARSVAVASKAPAASCASVSSADVRSLPGTKTNEPGEERDEERGEGLKNSSGDKPPPSSADASGTNAPPAPAIYLIRVDPVDAVVHIHNDRGRVSGSGAQRTVTIDRPDLHPYVLLLAERSGCATLETWLTPTAGLREELTLALVPERAPAVTTADASSPAVPQLLDSRQAFMAKKGSRAWHQGLHYTLRMGPDGDGTGFACVGFELAGVQRVQFEIQQIGEFRACTPRSFFGFIVDYHTADGYTWRVAIRMGLGSVKRLIQKLPWTQRAKPNQFVDWDAQSTGELDLALWAPAGWDNRVWISPLLFDAGAGASLSGRLIVPGLGGTSSVP